jgi:hypothetical protein
MPCARPSSRRRATATIANASNGLSPPRTRRRMPCPEQSSRVRARSPSTPDSRFARTCPRMRPAGSRGVTSTPAERSHADATTATASSASTA